MTLNIDRRTALTAAVAAGALFATQGAASAQKATPSAGAYQPRPLPFDPKTIPGLSEKILVSHHDNNYAGAVKRIGAIEAQVAALDPATAPGFMYNGLKREELMAMNSMILHEVYFASLGKGGGKPGASAGETDCDGFWWNGKMGRPVCSDGQGAGRRLGVGAAHLVAERGEAGQPVGRRSFDVAG